MKGLLRSPLVYAQLANAAFFLFAIGRVEPCLVIVILAIWYAVFLKFEKESLKRQREIYARIRNVVSKCLQMKKLQDIEPNDWETLNGPRKFSNALSLFGIGLIITFLWEGRYVGALNVATNFSYFYLASVSDNKQIIMFTGRFNAVMHIASIVSFGNTFSPEAARRMLLSRHLLGLSYFESIFELFLQGVIVPMTYLAFRFPGNWSLLCLPFAQFVMTIVPTEILGIRQYLLRKTTETKYISSTAYVAAVTMIVPIVIATFSYSFKNASTTNGYGELEVRSITKDAAVPSLILGLFPFAGLLATVMWSFWAEQIDLLVHPTYIHRVDRNWEWSGINFMTGTWICTLLALAFYQETFLYALVGLICFVGARVSCDEEVERILFYLFEISMFLHIPAIQSRTLNILLSSARLWTCFATRRISDIIVEHILIASVQSLACDKINRDEVIIIFLFGVIVALAMRITSENSRRFVKGVRNADSFLDLAVKQKFSSLGSAMHYIVETMGSSLDPTTMKVLDNAILECRLGLAACHLSSSAIKYDSGSFTVSPGRPLSVVHLLRDWNERQEFSTNLAVEGDEFIEAQLDWDLFKSLMIDMTRHCAALAEIDAVKSNPSNGPKIVVSANESTVMIEVVCQADFGRGKKQVLLHSIRDSVARALGGRLSSDGALLQFPIHHTLQEITSPPSGSISLMSQGSPSGIPTVDQLQRQQTTSRHTPLSTLKRLTPSLVKSFKFGGSGFNTPSPTIQSGSLSSRPGSRELSRMSLVGKKTSSSSSMDTVGSSTVSPPLGYRSLQSDHLNTTQVPLPKNLVIAILDDNNLVRKSLGYVVKMHLQADMEKSFVMGHSREEALKFPQAIIDRKVDIAIFDENLEFDHETLKGSTLASKALRKGFKGCLILHSANSSLADSMDKCFHGFVEKTSSKEQFTRCLSAAYQRYVESQSSLSS